MSLPLCECPHAHALCVGDCHPRLYVEAARLADLRITPVRKRRKTDTFCSSCGNFHDPNEHPPLGPRSW